MSNIRLFFSNTLSKNMIDKLDKSQSHYLTKVMRLKKNDILTKHYFMSRITPKNFPTASKEN